MKIARNAPMQLNCILRDFPREVSLPSPCKTGDIEVILMGENILVHSGLSSIVKYLPYVQGSVFATIFIESQWRSIFKSMVCTKQSCITSNGCNCTRYLIYIIILNLFCMENRKLNSLLIKLMCKVWHGMHSHAKAFCEFVNTKCNKN